MLPKSSILMAVAVVTTAFLFSGCTAKGPQFTSFKKPSKGTGSVYVYRPEAYFGAAESYDVHATAPSGKPTYLVGRLLNGGYLEHEFKAGKVEIWAETESKSSVQLDIKPNKIYCIKGGVNLGLIRGRPDLVQVDNKICEKEIKETRLSVN